MRRGNIREENGGVGVDVGGRKEEGKKRRKVERKENRKGE